MTIPGTSSPDAVGGRWRLFQENRGRSLFLGCSLLGFAGTLGTWWDRHAPAEVPSRLEQANVALSATLPRAEGSGSLAAAELVVGTSPAMESQPAPPRVADPGPAIDSSVRNLVDGSNRIAWESCRQLGESRPEQNLVVSPYGLIAALSLAVPGARGETGSQLVRLLNLPDEPTQIAMTFGELRREVHSAVLDGGRITGANRLWGQSGLTFKSGFLDAVGAFQDAAPGFVDFAGNPEAAAGTINRWISERTSGEIPRLVSTSDVDASTRLILTSALSFHGLWKSPFVEEATTTKPFFRPNGPGATASPIPVPMMFNRGKFRYVEADGFEVLELPYDGDRLSLIVLLPRPGDSLARLEQRLTTDPLERALARLEVQDVLIDLPRFKVRSDVALEDLLRRLDVTAAFSDQADFSGMVEGGEKLRLSRIAQQSMLSVDERGTSASSGTAAWLSGRSMPIHFEANRPFLFAVRDRARGLLLFVGRVVNPSAT